MRRHTNILILLLLTGLCISAGAQNNPYKIDDSLYPIFQRAIKWRTQPQGLLIADTLYAEATQKKDKKAQCLALTIPVSFYLSTNNYEKLEQAATRAKEEARKNNYLQYYYSACTNEINCLLNFTAKQVPWYESVMTKEACLYRYKNISGVTFSR